MTYRSVDELQNVLATTVFKYAVDRKKASGRALGTLVEIITFYLLRSWNFRDNIVIEKAIPEFGNSTITHNVEFSLHGIIRKKEIMLSELRLPISLSRVRAEISQFDSRTNYSLRSNSVVSADGVLRNSCIFAESDTSLITAHLDLLAVDAKKADLTLLALHKSPFAIFECKRVGVEEGMKKGPQSIEKAKQGAYVARTVSALQKIRLPNGKMGGLIFDGTGQPKIGEYSELIDEIVGSRSSMLLRNFVLTVGVVSNHGNWFTAEDHNKELKVLAQSYDWLVFLTDEGLGRFIQSLLLNPISELMPAREAFLSSYGPASGGNRFTKVKMDIRADAALQSYFRAHQDQAIRWFNVISPAKKSLNNLRRQLALLKNMSWDSVHGGK